MNVSRCAAIAHAWVSQLLAKVSPKEAPQADAGEDTYGEPTMVVDGDQVELRLFGDVIPHSFAYYFNPGEAVSDVGFLRALGRVPAETPVTVAINSPGGDVFAGTVIANAVAKRKAATRVDGIAASIASVILAAGKTAHVSRGATVMVHKPWSIAGGNATDMRAEADVLDKIEEAMVDIYTGKSGKKYSRAQWKAALAGPEGSDGSWWTGAEAVASGIADTYDAPAEPDKAKAVRNLEQRQKVAAMYCSKLPPNLSEALASVEGESPKAPASGESEAKPEPRASVRRPGVSYLNK